MSQTLRWGIAGTGNIAHTFAKALKVAKKGNLVAVGSRSKATALGFGKEFELDENNCFGSYSDLWTCPHVDIVYISTPHPQHYELAISAAKAGKHILIEKPMGMTEKQVESIIATAKEHKVFAMEAYMYRCHPQTIKLVELIKSGLIGSVKFIRASFSFEGVSLGPTSRLWRNELGGGAILDIGGYPMSFCRLIAAAANGKSVCNPTQVLAVGSIQDDTKVDEWSSATLQFEGGIGASVFTSVFIDGDNRVEVLGSKGSLTVENIWRPDLPQLGKVQIIHGGSETKVIEVPLEETNLFAYEADAVADAISQGQQECQYMTWEDTLGQVKAMDAWRKAIGLTYKEDSQ